MAVILLYSILLAVYMKFHKFPMLFPKFHAKKTIISWPAMMSQEVSTRTVSGV